MPKVDYVRDEVKAVLPSYNLIRDCVAGELTVKKKGDKYLPRPNASDVSPENVARYKAYTDRAVFYNVTKRTLQGLVGQVFLRDAVIEVPKLLEIVRDDASGGGVSAEQQAKRSASHVVAYGRSGLFVDYPTVEGVTSRADLETGKVRPTIQVYEPWRVINWRTTSRGGRELLSLVVLSEMYTTSDDGFEIKLAEQFRVLRLLEPTLNVEGVVDDGKEEPITGDLVYSVELYRKFQAGWGMVSGYPKIPLDASGNRLSELPFVFIGSENNDSRIDEPPLYDLASLNIAHYRNSADYEESSFIVGQPTPVLAGLTEDWVKDVLKGTVALGSRGAIALPEGGSATLLQAGPNTMPFEAMEHKERQMVALGAKLVEQKTVQRTATEAGIDHTSENSILASSAKNVSNAYTWAFKWCAKFVGESEDNIKFELNTEFDLTKMTPEERRQLIAEWQAGAISFTEMRDNLRGGGVAKLDDEAAKAEIDEELANAPKLDAMGNVITGNNNNQDPASAPGQTA